MKIKWKEAMSGKSKDIARLTAVKKTMTKTSRRLAMPRMSQKRQNWPKKRLKRKNTMITMTRKRKRAVKALKPLERL